MKTYHVQFRNNHKARLIGTGKWRARSEAGAIIRVAQMLRRAGESFVEIVATEVPA